MNSQLIRMEADINGYVEGIALDVNGLVSEGSGENVFVVRNGVLYTPPLANSALSGITRDSVLTIARHLGLTVVEQPIPREMLYIADEVFFTGTAAEVSPIRSVDRILVGDGKTGETTKKIADEFFAIANGLKPDRFGWLTPVKVNASEPVSALALLDNENKGRRPDWPPFCLPDGLSFSSPRGRFRPVQIARTWGLHSYGMLCLWKSSASFSVLPSAPLLPLVNPLGDALVFLGLVGRAPSAVYRSLAKKIAISTALFLITIEVIGTAMLRFFASPCPSCRWPAALRSRPWDGEMLNKERADTKQETAELDDHAIGSLTQKIFYPFTFPITAGPGCIVVMVTLSAHASVKSVLLDAASHGGHRCGGCYC